MTDCPRTNPTSLARSPRRLLLAGVGIVSTAVGLIGAFVPGLPTTVFLLFASFCFTRSCPMLEALLIRNRVFAPYMKYMDGSATMPMHARVITIVVMWASIGGSLWLLASTDRLPIALAAILIACAVIGAWVVARWRRACPAA